MCRHATTKVPYRAPSPAAEAATALAISSSATEAAVQVTALYLGLAAKDAIAIVWRFVLMEEKALALPFNCRRLANERLPDSARISMCQQPGFICTIWSGLAACPGNHGLISPEESG
jgi:hypothetical protein